MLDNFYVSKYSIEIKILKNSLFPISRNFNFKDVFFNYLKEHICYDTERLCTDCDLIHSCKYQILFSDFSKSPYNKNENKYLPSSIKPYLIEIPDEIHTHCKKGEILKFSLVLMCNAVDYAQYFILALREMGKAKKNFELIRVFSEDILNRGQRSEIYFHDSDIIKNQHFVLSYNDFMRIIPDNKKLLHLHFITPAKMKNNRISKSDFNLFLDELIKRIDFLVSEYGDKNTTHDFSEFRKIASKVNIIDNKISLNKKPVKNNKYNFYSSGIIGDIEFGGKIYPFLPLFRLGEIIHIGSDVEFGGGKYEIQ